MHDIKWIRDNPDAFDRGLARRSLPAQSASLIELDERRRAAILKAEQAQARRNAASKDIGAAKKNKDEAAAVALMAEVNALKELMPALEAEEKKLSKELNDALATIPNLPGDDVPDGKDEHDNVARHHFGAKRNYAFTPKQHFELGEDLGFMDFESAAKLSGARFVVLKKGLARLERAIGQFMLDLHTTEHGYEEINPPLLVKDEVMFGTAQLPKFEDDQFRTGRSLLVDELLTEMRAEVKKIWDERPATLSSGAKTIPAPEMRQLLRERLGPWTDRLSDAGGAPIDNLDEQLVAEANKRELNLWLIPTAEVPMTNLVRESIVDEQSLPRRYTALTPCFRAEAGAAGRDTRGMIRQHQFTKVELVSITTPEKSKDEHERMLASAEEVLRRLGLHYRVVTLCTGDMGFASQKTYDIEVWLPGQGMYREISSCSNCGDFQARRMMARYRPKKPVGAAMLDTTIVSRDLTPAPPRFVHTLNGSGTAVGRALIAVMETYQQQGGSIAVPDVLQRYMGDMRVIERAG